MEKCKVNSTQIITSIITIGSISLIGLWFNAAQAQRLSGYVDKPLWAQKNDEIYKQYLELKGYVQDGRVERIAFQKAVLDYQADMVQRLTRIESLFAAHANNEKKP